MVCHNLPATANAVSSTAITKCGLPVETSTPAISVPSASVTVRGAKLGMPMPVVTSTSNPPLARTLFTRHTRSPASVSMERLSPACAPSASAIHAATQRVPLPLISATEPSALCRRIAPEQGPVQRKNSMPSAPTPVLRAQSRRVSAAQSWLATASSVTMRKSLPQACALVNEINLPPDRGRF
jgi:hypothetical protein